MKKHFAHAVLAAALLCSSAGVAMIVSPSAARADDAKKKPSVSHDVGAALNAAINAVKDKDYKTAMAKIKEAEAVDDKTPYDSLKINQIKAFISIPQHDYATATMAYNAMVSSPAFDQLDKSEQVSTLHNAVLLNGQSKDWAHVIADSKKLESMMAMDAKLYPAVAQAYYFSNDYANAEKTAQQLIDMQKAKGEKPQKFALEIVMSAQAKTNDQAGALKTLEQLALYYDAPSDWGQVIDHALGTSGMTELDGLYLYRLRFLAGAPSMGDDYTTAAGIALHNGYPGEAESYLQKGINSGKLKDSGKVAQQMRQAHSQARTDQRQLKAFAAAAKRSKNGVQDVKLAEDYWGYGRYADAAAAATDGLAKGHMKDSEMSEGNFILGISLVAQGKYADAQQALGKVDGAPARANAARVWDLYAQSKLKATGTTASAAATSQPQ